MDILTLPDEIMLVYLLVHAEYHILNEGLGLRQLCDIAIFIKKHFTAEDSIQDKLDRCGISQISAAIGHILHKDLGLDKNLIPFRISSKGAEIIREDIWAFSTLGLSGLCATIDFSARLVNSAIRQSHAARE